MYQHHISVYIKINQHHKQDHDTHKLILNGGDDSMANWNMLDNKNM
jgi:hypothetical protein